MCVCVCGFFPASLFSIVNYIGFVLCSSRLTVQCWQMNSGAYVIRIIVIIILYTTSHGERERLFLSHLTCRVHMMTDLSFILFYFIVCVSFICSHLATAHTSHITDDNVDWSFDCKRTFHKIHTPHRTAHIYHIIVCLNDFSFSFISCFKRISKHAKEVIIQSRAFDVLLILVNGQHVFLPFILIAASPKQQQQQQR